MEEIYYHFFENSLESGTTVKKSKSTTDIGKRKLFPESKSKNIIKKNGLGLKLRT